MIIFSDSTDRIFNSRDPNRVPKTPIKHALSQAFGALKKSGINLGVNHQDSSVVRDVTRGQGGHNSRALNDCEGAEKSQQCHKYFLQYRTCASERHQARTRGRQNCFGPDAI